MFYTISELLLCVSDLTAYVSNDRERSIKPMFDLFSVSIGYITASSELERVSEFGGFNSVAQ